MSSRIILTITALALATLNVSQMKTPKFSGVPRNVYLLAALHHSNNGYLYLEACSAVEAESVLNGVNKRFFDRKTIT